MDEDKLLDVCEYIHNEYANYEAHNELCELLERHIEAPVDCEINLKFGGSFADHSSEVAFQAEPKHLSGFLRPYLLELCKENILEMKKLITEWSVE